MESSNTIPVSDPTSAKKEATAVSGGGGNSTALDQWRGLALVFVLISHGFFFTDRVHGIGRVGVNLFFFISGLLVFRTLARQRENTGWAIIRGFWKRRARRLYPAMATYVLAMLPVVYALRHRQGALDLGVGQYLRGVPYALTYLVNYWPSGPASLGHLWSLSCEMQFYFLAPVIFLLGGRTTLRRHLVWGALLLALAVTGLVGSVLDTKELYRYHFEIAVWPMMLGFCFEFRKDWFQRVPATWFPLIIGTSLVAFGVIIVLMLSGLPMKKPVVAIGTFAFVPCLLAYVGGRPLGGPVGRTLTWLGERTYSIYLWQEPLTICRYLPALWHPVGAVVSVFVGGAWFRLFERPFLSAGRKH
ncbi:MAG: acyltransferase [Verrucomicrobiia bacterium]